MKLNFVKKTDVIMFSINLADLILIKFLCAVRKDIK